MSGGGVVLGWRKPKVILPTVFKRQRDSFERNGKEKGILPGEILLTPGIAAKQVQKQTVEGTGRINIIVAEITWEEPKIRRRRRKLSTFWKGLCARANILQRHGYVGISSFAQN